MELVEIPEDSESELSIEALIARQVQVFEMSKARWKRAGARQIKMPPGPFAVAHLGDPHVDDDGCDWPELLRTIETVNKTEGMYAANGGDSSNRWVGFLQRKYGDQISTRDDEDRLVEWLFESTDWLYIMLGNHDLWNSGAALLSKYAEKRKVGVIAPDDIKIELLSPDGPPCRIHARHDHRGHSMWNPAHGPLRAAKLGGWAHIYIAFHRHIWVDHREECDDGVIRWALRARGFKRHDDYARSKGLSEHQHGETLITVHDPAHPHPGERVSVHLDIEEAADILGFKRSRRGY